MAAEEDKEEKKPNECCQKWKDKLLKAESGRRKLREAINILEHAVKNSLEEIGTLKKECENEQKRAEDENRRAQEEKRQRLEQEKECNSLKAEFASVTQRLEEFESKIKIEEEMKVEYAKVKKDNVNEENKLRELLEKERQALEFEKIKSEEMKKQASAEKKKAEEEKKRADIARKKAEEERKCAGTERRKFEEEKKRVDAERKRAEDEKIIREMLEKKLQQLELEKQSVEEARRYNESKENTPALVESADKKKSKGEKMLKEHLKKEQQQLKAERKRAEEQKKRIESLEKEQSVLKEQLEKEQQCLKDEMKRTEEEKRQKQTLERECSVLKQQLGPALGRNSDRKKLKGEKILEKLLKKEQQGLRDERKRAEEQKKRIASLEKEHFLLKEQFEKAEMKRAAEEKRQREALEKECSILKKELACVIRCLKSHEGQLNDTRRELQQWQMEAQRVDGSSICTRTLAQSVAKTRAIKPNESASMLIEDEIQGNNGFNNSSVVKGVPDSGLSISGGNITKPIPGISCVLEALNRGSVEKTMQSSALHSTVTSFSDRQLVESQGRGAHIASNSSKAKKHKKKRELVVPLESPATAKKVCTRVMAFPEAPRIDEDVMDHNEKRSVSGKQLQKCAGEMAIHKEINGALEEKKYSARKRKSGPENIADSIMDLFHKEKKMHLMIEEKLESLREALRAQVDSSVDVPSLKQRGFKHTCIQKRDNATNALHEEDMEFEHHKVDECKADHSMKEDWSGNCSQFVMPNQENELQEDEGDDKEQTCVKDIPVFTGIGTYCGRGGKLAVESSSNLVEIASDEQVKVMDTECRIDFDFKRMLQLDNESDEEFYIQAKESLLSPTLPEMPSPPLEELEGVNFYPFLEETSFNSNQIITTRDSCTNDLENLNNVPSQGLGAIKTFELPKVFDEESRFKVKQNLSSVSGPEIPFGVMERLEGHCTDSLHEEAPSQFIASIVSGDCAIGGFENNKIMTNFFFSGNSGIPDNHSFDVISEDDILDNIDKNKCYESCREEIDEHIVEPELSQHYARDVGNNEGARGESINDLSSGKSSRNLDFKSIQPTFNKQTKFSAKANSEEQCTESAGRDANGVAGCSVEQIKELRIYEDEKHGSFNENVLKTAELVIQKCRNYSSQHVADDDEIVRICKGSSVSCLPIRSSNVFSAGGMSSESIQPGHEKRAGSEGSFGSSSTQGSVLEQVNEFGGKLEGRKQRCPLNSCQEWLKAAKICEGQDQRCFSFFWIISSCYEDENGSYRLFKNITSYSEVMFDASSGVPDLERLVLTFDSATNLSRVETVCICISVLVRNLASLEANMEARRSCDTDHAYFLWSKNLMDQISRVSSKNATQGAFSKVFVFDILVSLLTKFLIEGEVMVYTASASGKDGFSNFNGRLLETEQRQFSVLRRIATVAEVEAGCHVLAAFCLALGNVDCLYEVMYTVLRWCKKDCIWILGVVHSIAFICWKHLVQVSKSNLLGNTIFTIILLLQGHEKGVPQSLPNHSVFSTVQKQRPALSVHCPFADDVPNMDAIISSLLETLCHFPVSGYRDEKTPYKFLGCGNSAFIENAERKVECLKTNYWKNDGFVALKNLQEVSKQGDQCQNKTVDFPCNLPVLNDTVRALELVAQYLGWDWTYNELIPHFWRIAQPNAPELLIMTIFLLIGKVGRFGIDCDGCEQRGVEELRQNFSTLLDLHCMTKGRHIFPFSCQLAAAQSLFELMSRNMKMATANQVEHAQGIVDREIVHSTHSKILKKWYSNLNTEQQSMLPEYMRADIFPLTS